MLKKRLNSFRYAFAGLGELLRSQPNAKIHLVAACAVAAAGFYFEITTTEWCLATFAVAMVFSAEAFNTAIENLTDLASPDYHPLAGKAKDVAAAAVLVAAIGAAAVGLLIFGPRVLGAIGL
ncbi:MAG: diacylglycerol kinase family protein [Lewinellaceae bacterium]|nr:diacylglycerol kinase family protein [Saprospiraceae bacterium]MCB9337147.1 diacylglycerol kinase family protein [Lewinellaceae bacterium]